MGVSKGIAELLGLVSELADALVCECEPLS